MAEHGIDYWKAKIIKLANITPHDKKAALDWLDAENKIQNDNEQAYHKYRNARLLIPAFAEAMEDGKDKKVLEIIKAKKLKSLSRDKISTMKAMIGNRNTTQIKLKTAGMKLHYMKVKKLINENTGEVNSNIDEKKKIHITPQQAAGLWNAGFHANEIWGMFTWDNKEEAAPENDRGAVKTSLDNSIRASKSQA